MISIDACVRDKNGVGILFFEFKSRFKEHEKAIKIRKMFSRKILPGEVFTLNDCLYSFMFDVFLFMN